KLPAWRFVRHPGRLGFIRTVAWEPAIGVPASMHVRLADAVVRRHNSGKAIHLLPQAVPDGALDGRPLLPWVKAPGGEQLVQPWVVHAAPVHRLGKRGVESQIDPVHKAWPGTDRTGGG